MDDFSRHLDAISDGVAQLESKLALGPDPLLEAATKDIRFGRDGLARICADLRRSRLRDHPVASPTTPTTKEEMIGCAPWGTAPPRKAKPPASSLATSTKL